MPTPEALVARAEAQRSVVDAVLALAEPYRSTVLLHYFEDLSSAEIARRLGIPDGTVRRRLKVAVDRLRAQLGANESQRRRALAPLLAPLASASSLPISAGAIAMKKLAAAVVVAIVLVGLGAWWKHERAVTARPPQPPGSASTNLLGSSSDRNERASVVPAWFVVPGAPARVIAGRVTFGGAPAGGAVVTLQDPLTHAGARPAREQRTDATGHFDFGAQPPSAWYEITASAPEHAPVVAVFNLADPTARPPSDSSSSASADAPRASAGPYSMPPATRFAARTCCAMAWSASMPTSTALIACAPYAAAR